MFQLFDESNVLLYLVQWRPAHKHLLAWLDPDWQHLLMTSQTQAYVNYEEVKDVDVKEFRVLAVSRMATLAQTYGVYSCKLYISFVYLKYKQFDYANTL